MTCREKKTVCFFMFVCLFVWQANKQTKKTTINGRENFLMTYFQWQATIKVSKEAKEQSRAMNEARGRDLLFQQLSFHFQFLTYFQRCFIQKSRNSSRLALPVQPT